MSLSNRQVTEVPVIRGKRGGLVLADPRGRVSGIPYELRSVPDRELKKVALRAGFSRLHAGPGSAPLTPLNRFLLLQLWALEWDKNAGIPAARVEWDAIRSELHRLRMEEIIADTDRPDDYSVL